MEAELITRQSKVGMTPQELREARATLGMSQKAFAEAIGLNRLASVSDMETGKANVTRQTEIIVEMLLAKGA